MFEIALLPFNSVALNFVVIATSLFVLSVALSALLDKVKVVICRSVTSLTRF